MRNSRTLVFASLMAILTCLRSSAAGEPSPTDALPLAEAISSFNAKATQDPIGKEQPPLTEDEVIAAIRWWESDRKESPVSDGEFRAFLNIAETRRLPAGWTFEVLTHFEPDDRLLIEAWSVRIVMPRINGGTYEFRVRERMVRSRLIGTDERKVIEKWQKSGIRSLQREQYARERQAAAEVDESKSR
jgi:hypothetical protein